MTDHVYSKIKVIISQCTQYSCTIKSRIYKYSTCTCIMVHFPGWRCPVEPTTVYSVGCCTQHTCHLRTCALCRRTLTSSVVPGVTRRCGGCAHVGNICLNNHLRVNSACKASTRVPDWSFSIWKSNCDNIELYFQIGRASCRERV